MHVVNTLEDAQAVLRALAEKFGRDGAAGALLPAGEVGFAQSLLQRLAANPDEGEVPHADSSPHPDFLSVPSAHLEIRPLPQGEVSPAAPLVHQIQLCSPPFAACYAGVNYYRHLVDALAAEFPEVPFEFTLCCGDDAAIAHDARRLGFTHVLCRQA